MEVIMKKYLLIPLLISVAFTGAFAVDYKDMANSFDQFSKDVSESLPFNSTMGLNWSDARVRGFPHFGIGLSVGATAIPEDTFKRLADNLGIALPAELTDTGLGIPVPGYTVDARIGLPFLPFDIGVKLGTVPEGIVDTPSLAMDYTLAGFDIRTPIVKQNLLLPAVTLGVGFNYLKSTIGTYVDTGIASSIDLSSVDSNLGTLTFNDPEVAFTMETKVIDFKLQVSKKILIFTPYVGAGYSYGWSNAGGGVYADVEYDGNPITQADIDAINAAFDDKGIDRPDLSVKKITVSSDNTGSTLRAFGGISVNLILLKLDLNGMYNVSTQSLGASVNARMSF